MWARQAFVIPGFGRVSQAAEDLSEEALFGILRASLAQVLAHLGFANMSWFGHDQNTITAWTLCRPSGLKVR